MKDIEQRVELSSGTERSSIKRLSTTAEESSQPIQMRTRKESFLALPNNLPIELPQPVERQIQVASRSAPLVDPRLNFTKETLIDEVQRFQSPSRTERLSTSIFDLECVTESLPQDVHRFELLVRDETEQIQLLIEPPQPVERQIQLPSWSEPLVAPRRNFTKETLSDGVQRFQSLSRAERLIASLPQDEHRFELLVQDETEQIQLLIEPPQPVERQIQLPSWSTPLVAPRRNFTKELRDGEQRIQSLSRAERLSTSIRDLNHATESLPQDEHRFEFLVQDETEQIPRINLLKELPQPIDEQILLASRSEPLITPHLNFTEKTLIDGVQRFEFQTWDETRQTSRLTITEQLSQQAERLREKGDPGLASIFERQSAKIEEAKKIGQSAIEETRCGGGYEF